MPGLRTLEKSRGRLAERILGSFEFQTNSKMTSTLAILIVGGSQSHINFLNLALLLEGSCWAQLFCGEEPSHASEGTDRAGLASWHDLGRACKPQPLQASSKRCVSLGLGRAVLSTAGGGAGSRSSKGFGYYEASLCDVMSTSSLRSS